MTAEFVTERFRILGDVGAAVFPVWVAAHARRLGLVSRVLSQDAGCLDVVVTGPPALIDAMALGCSLGPIVVWVDEIMREAQPLGVSEND